MDRHYKDVSKYHSQYVRRGSEIPWEDKLPAVVWRGKPTGMRVKQVKPWIHYADPEVVNVAFSDVSTQVGEGALRDFTQDKSVRERLDISDMIRYKYLLSVEGNDVATGLKWMLYSNSVVMMAPPTRSTWAMEDLLLPFVHYVPLSNDLSNLLDMIEWAEQHEDECREISARSTEFIQRLWMSKQARRDHSRLRKMLATAYANQFKKALSKCRQQGEGGKVNFTAVSVRGQEGNANITTTALYRRDNISFAAQSNVSSALDNTSLAQATLLSSNNISLANSNTSFAPE